MAKKQNNTSSANGQTVVAKIISEFKDRNRAEIKKWQSALTLATNPDTPRLYQLQDLYDNLESDGHFISQVNLRKAATLCNSFSVIDRKSSEVNVEKTELLNTEWFYDFVGYALDSVIKGYTLLELVNPGTMEFMLIPRRNLVPTKKLVLFEAAGDKGIDYSVGFERTLIHIGKEEDLGLMSNLCGQLIWKRNAQQSWAEFAEKYGMPLISATTNKTAQADINKIENMLVALGEAARAVLPEGTTIDIKPFAGSDSYQVYDKQIERINSEIGKPITGGTMISDNGSSRSQSEVHERNLDDKISQFDRRLIEFTVNGQLFPIMQMWGHNINPETDKFAFDDSFELSLKEHWDVINSALYHYEIPEDWISKTFNFPITGKKEMQQQPIFAQLDSKNKNRFSANFQ
ncbi:MAG: DUF935 domain-containing protein [Prevotellaceae bacterium]|jgi:phage gp29-like protein|nr:DUF935 domain-containing protein [Prevotellaceae bacterium]